MLMGRYEAKRANGQYFRGASVPRGVRAPPPSRISDNAPHSIFNNKGER